MRTIALLIALTIPTLAQATPQPRITDSATKACAGGMMPQTEQYLRLRIAQWRDEETGARIETAFPAAAPYNEISQEVYDMYVHCVRDVINMHNP